jgi:hypothetical protein
MALTTSHDPSSLDLMRAEEKRRDRTFHISPTAEEFDHHLTTYRKFILGVWLFIGHIALILILLDIFLR